MMKIPRKYFEIVKEKKKPTRYVMNPKTGQLLGRLEKGDKRKKGLVYGKKAGRTRAIRMKKDFRGLEKGQVIGRTKKVYPRQVNSVLVRKGEMGEIKAVKIVVEKYKRKSKKGKKHKVRRHRKKVKKYKRKR